MQKRREFVDLTKLIFTFLKNNKNKEFSINQISKKIKTRWNTTAKSLELLKFFNLVKCRIEENKKNLIKFYTFK